MPQLPTPADLTRMQRAMLTVPGVTLPRYGADGSYGAEFEAAFAKVVALAGGNPVATTDPYALTERVLLEILHHEAIVREAYKDSEGVWTWGVGQTKASGVDPLAWKDRPAGLEVVLGSFVGALRERYVPDVRAAFGDYVPTEAVFAAALSFHWNTGAIGRASWVKYLLAGAKVNVTSAAFLDWNKPATIRARRQAEHELLFFGNWAGGDGLVTEYPVRKPSYAPNWGAARKVDVRGPLRTALAA